MTQSAFIRPYCALKKRNWIFFCAEPGKTGFFVLLIQFILSLKAVESCSISIKIYIICVIVYDPTRPEIK